MMNANAIASADLLDIIFDGRNKAYGAYQLRRDYNKRLGISVASVLAFCLLIYLPVFFKNEARIKISPGKIDDTVTLSLYDPAHPEPVTPHESRARQVQYTAPLITSEENITENELPPIETVQNAIVGTSDEPGVPGDGNEPASEGNNATVAQPAAVHEVPEDTVFRKVEIEARFNGDWRQFLERNLVYPEEAIESEKQGVVKVQFIVDKKWRYQRYNGFI
jgi:protein TonB